MTALSIVNSNPVSAANAPQTIFGLPVVSPEGGSKNVAAGCAKQHNEAVRKTNHKRMDNTIEVFGIRRMSLAALHGVVKLDGQ